MIQEFFEVRVAVVVRVVIVRCFLGIEGIFLFPVVRHAIVVRVLCHETIFKFGPASDFCLGIDQASLAYANLINHPSVDRISFGKDRPTLGQIPLECIFRGIRFHRGHCKRFFSFVDWFEIPDDIPVVFVFFP